MKNDWNYVGGCSIKHPFNEEKRADCEETWKTKPKNIGAQSDLLLAQAAAEKASKNPQKSWTATQTAMVVGVSLLGIAVMVAIIIKVRNKNKG